MLRRMDGRSAKGDHLIFRQVRRRERTITPQRFDVMGVLNPTGRDAGRHFLVWGNASLLPRARLRTWCSDRPPMFVTPHGAFW